MLADTQVQELLQNHTYGELMETIKESEEVRDAAFSIEESGSVHQLSDMVFGSEAVPPEYKTDVSELIRHYCYQLSDNPTVMSNILGEPNETIWDHLKRVSVFGRRA